MCGRYYVDGSTFQEAEKLLEEMSGMLSGRLAAEPVISQGSLRPGGLHFDGLNSGNLRPGGPHFDGQNSGDLRPGDLHPGDLAPVLACDRDGTAHIQWQRWGFPGLPKGGLIFNARSETAAEKRMFRDGLARHRIVIPARQFYEWNRAKEKVTFLRRDEPVLYMAGFYDLFEDGPHFVILTTQANDSMRQTHDRMPLILEREEAKAWLDCGTEPAPMLEKTPPELDKQAEYEQISFL